MGARNGRTIMPRSLRQPPGLKPAASMPPGPVYCTVSAALARLQAQEAALAPLALSIAHRLDREADGPASGMAALSRELRATMAEITREVAPSGEDEIQRIRARRAARRGE
jgi:hypothetical protein